MEVARCWHPTRNDQSPYEVVATSIEPYWWECMCGFVWQASCNDRVAGGRGCARCRKSVYEKSHPWETPPDDTHGAAMEPDAWRMS